jgi:molybdopterin-guanine dinucleotide biosynthesis protein MobB
LQNDFFNAKDWKDSSAKAAYTDASGHNWNAETRPSTDSVQEYGAPVLAVCGFSGSGKTTLLEAAIPHLVAHGLAVAVIKHDAHGFVVDTPGKDSDRLFRAGASIALRGPNEQFHRRNASAALSLSATLAWFACDHDLLLVEGHKDTPLQKFWLEDSARTAAPANITNVVATLPWNGPRLETFLGYVDAWLPKSWSERPLYRGLLIGGKSLRLGSPKQLLKFGDRQLGEIVADALGASLGSAPIVALGAGVLPQSLENLPRLTDCSGFEGPCAGIVAAHRWAPEAAWIVAACDHPWLRPATVEWLSSQRRPGTWAVVPRQKDGHPCPTLALYEPQSLATLERIVRAHPERDARLAMLLDHRRTVVVTPPPEHTKALRSVNTLEEFRSETLLYMKQHCP